MLLGQAQKEMDAAADAVWTDRPNHPRFKIVFVQHLFDVVHSSVSVEVAPDASDTYTVRLDPDNYLQATLNKTDISGALAHEACHIKHGDNASENLAERREQERSADQCVGEAGPKYALSRARNLLGLHEAHIAPDKYHPQWLESIEAINTGLKQAKGLTLTIKP